jgi:Xaa-Pro aminopeptidase
MIDFAQRMKRFQEQLGAHAELAFVPVSTDLEYLTGIPRDIPNFGVTLHPGAWLEGAWISPRGSVTVTLPRMSADYGGLAESAGSALRILGDWDDPAELVRDVLSGFGLPDKVRIAVSDRAHAESVIQLQALFPLATFISATEILREQRVIKDADEVRLMREAGEVTERAFAAVIDKLKLGMTELDLVSEVDYQMKRFGSLGPSFTTSLYNTGPGYPLIHGNRTESWKRVIEPPVSVLFDFGAVYQGMCYDFGRTVSFGEPSEEQIRVHRLVMDAQQAGIAMLRAGSATCEQADAAARKVIADAGYGDRFRHRLGHGIGKDVHEPPFLTQGSTTVLEAGMMFTVEPSILTPNGFSARVEDVVLAMPGSGQPLTSGFQDLIVVS